MIKKLAFMAIGALVFSGCGSVTDNGVTTEDIKAKSKVLIVTSVSETSCVLIGIAVSIDYPSSKTLPADNSVTCATYGKIEGDNCTQQTLAEWQNKYPNAGTTISSGDKACVVGGDIPAN